MQRYGSVWKDGDCFALTQPYTTGTITQNCTVTALFTAIETSCYDQDVVIGSGISYASQDSIDIKTQGSVVTNGSVMLTTGA